MRAPAIAFAVFAATVRPAAAADVDVMLQAGHQGRPASCASSVHACNLGTGLGMQLERDWTPIVADSAAIALRAAGLTVMRRPADYRAHDRARAAVFLHFDGSAPACRSGASVGFPASTNRAFIRAWEREYRAMYPFRFAGENITQNEAHYYAYRNVDTPGRSMLIEFGEMTCPSQERWLQPRLRELGRRLAAFLIGELRP